MRTDSFYKYFKKRKKRGGGRRAQRERREKKKKTRTEHVVSTESLTSARDEPGSAQTGIDHTHIDSCLNF